MKPILFNTDMVRAILDGRKTATRRIVKAPVLYSGTEPPSRIFRDGDLFQFQWNTGKTVGGFAIKPPYLPGDVLYVRETWTKDNHGKYYFRADFDSDYLDPCETLSGGYPESCAYHPGCDGCEREPQRIRWHPSIHMPKEAARLFLRVTDVRVERLQEIMNDPPGPNNQIVREGCKYGCDFIAIWESTVQNQDWDHYGWDANPYVWVIEFERCEKPEADT